MIQRLLDRLLRDLVKHQTLDRNLGLEQLVQMPADRFSLPILIRRQIEAGTFLEQLLQLIDVLFLARRNYIDWREFVIHVDAQIRPLLLLELLRDFLGTLRQIADMTDTSFNREVLAQQLGNRPRLCGGLNDNQ